MFKKNDYYHRGSKLNCQYYKVNNDYYLIYISMLLLKEFAKSLDKDLSLVKYSPLVKKLYYYKGEM